MSTSSPPLTLVNGAGVDWVPWMDGWAVGRAGTELVPQANAAATSADSEEKTKTRMCIGETLPARSSARQALTWVVLLPLVWVLYGCSSPTDDFIGARVLDPCNSSWPICDGYGSCILGPESYTEGNLPGQGNIIVQTLADSSNVTLSFLFSNLTAAGGTFSIVFYEPGCVGTVSVDVPGETVAEESQSLGVFARSAQLVAGDHLVTYQSTTAAYYLLKVDVVPLND